LLRRDRPDRQHERGEAVSYQWTLDRARELHDRRAIDALVRMGPPPYTGDWRGKTVTQRRYLGRFGGEVHASRNGAFGVVIPGLLFSRLYTLTDRIHFFGGVLGSMKVLWPQLLEVDLFESVPEIAVPVFFMEEDTTKRLERKSRSGTSMRSGHRVRNCCGLTIGALPNSEQRDLFTSLMVEKVLPIAAGRDGRATG